MCCWHKWKWEEPVKERVVYYETAWSTPLYWYEVRQYATCKKCGKTKRRKLR